MEILLIVAVYVVAIAISDNVRIHAHFGEV